MKRLFPLTILLLFIGTFACAQVDAIKKGGRSGGSDRGRSSGAGSGMAAYFLVDFAVRSLVPWQINTLQKRGDVPNVLSLEVYGQAAIQPSTYYIFNPRVRGNWGIFFSDLRMNYMVEDKIGGPSDLRTDDWQILGLNVVNSRMVTGRLSMGIMHEAYNGGHTFQESAAGLSVMTRDQRIGAIGEFRWAHDHNTGSSRRLEASLNVQRKLYDRRSMHLYATGGVMFQRYYNDITVWGVQAGLALKLYRLNEL